MGSRYRPNCMAVIRRNQVPLSCPEAAGRGEGLVLHRMWNFRTACRKRYCANPLRKFTIGSMMFDGPSSEKVKT